MPAGSTAGTRSATRVVIEIAPSRVTGRAAGSLDDRGRDNAEPTGYVYVAMGRSAGMRPGDLVGAIANETGLEGRQIGPIRIADHYSVVGVPERRPSG